MIWWVTGVLFIGIPVVAGLMIGRLMPARRAIKCVAVLTGILLLGAVWMYFENVDARDGPMFTVVVYLMYLALPVFSLLAVGALGGHGLRRRTLRRQA
ncbi:hypothetical protein [Nitratireductor indicus]|uniref:Transmembrane protein n=1 Tax=Nitratireductor indicus C115 TaxID=1231190 RepID=K2NS63_9HYPH|nr:hypothetical protein [Nitratireductor indicus]EKF42160.1 hypothetical protein NA8A_11445 [Nitratireductor indicus C115]MDS1136239.1 hypothetical protein [Nitratireductor indicus]SFQ61563.1 hypothetical protein SAMN05216176_107212 [Nitratireductor indicus]